MSAGTNRTNSHAPSTLPSGSAAMSSPTTAGPAPSWSAYGAASASGTTYQPTSHASSDERAAPPVGRDLDEPGGDAADARRSTWSDTGRGGRRGAVGHAERGRRTADSANVDGVAQQRDGGAHGGDEHAACGEADQLRRLAGDLPDGEAALVQLAAEHLGAERALRRGVRRAEQHDDDQ